MLHRVSRRSALIQGLGLAVGCAMALGPASACLARAQAAPQAALAASVAPEGGSVQPGFLSGILAEAGAGASAPTPPGDLAPGAAGAVLMDAASGQVLWSKHPNARRPVASVTKLMTMALVLDAIRSGRVRWNDLVSASENAVRTGGAQIWLELGETMTVRDLFYAVAVQSANDAAVALAEYVGGTEPHFIEMMNAKAQALGMRDTLYTDPNGLDDVGQYSSAYDVALLSRYLVTADPDVLQYTRTWEHRLRGNKLWLVNRNKLLTRLPGVDGLKTGYTSRAGFCLSATAQRGSTRLIAVVLGAPTSEARFDETAAMLQWGFSHYVTVPVVAGDRPVRRLPVEGGTVTRVAVVAAHAFGITVPRGQERAVAWELRVPPMLAAPLRARQPVGTVTATVGGRPVAEVPLVVADAVPRVGPVWLWMRLWRGMWPWLQRP